MGQSQRRPFSWPKAFHGRLLPQLPNAAFAFGAKSQADGEHGYAADKLWKLVY